MRKKFKVELIKEDDSLQYQVGDRFYVEEGDDIFYYIVDKSYDQYYSGLVYIRDSVVVIEDNKIGGEII